jgi:flagellar hook assembly protein FlgD
VHSTIGTSWTDPEYDGWNVHYKITALDYVGNESDPASSGTATAVTEPVIPKTYAVYQNVPNPFNPTTVIHYDVPAGQGKVTIRIFDVGGRLVRTLLDDPQSAGQKIVTWNGRDDGGQSVASGVYFYRMTAPGYERTRKMVLLR